MKKLSYLKFNTESNNYIYDPAMSRILENTPERKLILDNFFDGKKNIIEKGRKLKLPLENLEIDFQLIEMMYSEGAFRSTSEKKIFLKNSEQILSTIIDSASSQLILSLTEDCNLRCEYCVYSERYPNNKGFSNISMNKETAFKAVDFYFKLYNQKKERGYINAPSISFYGGEPLIKFKLIKQVMDYAINLNPLTEFAITTNGILLTEKVREYFYNKKINITFSVDGYRANHDRNRLDKHRNPTFDKIMNNIFELQKLKQKNSIERLLTFSFCIDEFVDFTKMIEYFSIHDSILFPYTFFISEIIPYDTSYFEWTKNRMSDEDKTLREKSSKMIMNSIRIDKIYKKDNSEVRKILNLYRPFIFSDWMTNQRDTNGYQGLLNHSCFPGDKICVYPNGEIAICEKMNQKHCIGNISDGFDYEKIITNCNKLIMLFNDRCRSCKVRQLCDVCFMYFDDENRIPSTFCHNTLKNKTDQLRSYVKSIESKVDFNEIEKIVKVGM